MHFQAAGRQALFCPDVHPRRIDLWRQLGGAVVTSAEPASIHFSDDPNNSVVRSLIEPSSIRAPTTYVYSTNLIEDAVQAAKDGHHIEEIDRYLLPPAIFLFYNAQEQRRMPRNEEDDDEIETDANARQGGDSAAVFSRPVGRSESRPQSGPTKRTREESRTRARTASPVKRHVNSKTAPEKKQISPARKRVPEKKPLTLSTAAAAIRQQRAAVATLSGADPVAGARDPKASQRSRPSAAGAGAPKVCVPPPKRKESWTNFGDFIPNSYGYRVTLKPDIDLSSIASRTAGATSIQSSNSRDVRPQPPVKAVEISSPREPGKAKSPFLKPRPRVAASTRPSPGTGGPRPSSGPKPALSSHGNAQDVESAIKNYEGQRAALGAASAKVATASRKRPAASQKGPAGSTAAVAAVASPIPQLGRPRAAASPARGLAQKGARSPHQPAAVLLEAAASSDEEQDSDSLTDAQDVAGRKRGVDTRASSAFGRVRHELSGDVETAAKVVANAIGRETVAGLRWTRTLDTSLRTACAGVTRPNWTHVAASVGREPVDCKERWQFLELEVRKGKESEVH